MTAVIFRLLAALVAAISLSAAAADGEKQQQWQAQGQPNTQATQDSAAAAARARANAPYTNPRCGPSSSGERTAEPAPGGYGPPAGDPQSPPAK